jgi:hypothetical protein
MIIDLLSMRVLLITKGRQSKTRKLDDVGVGRKGKAASKGVHICTAQISSVPAGKRRKLIRILLSWRWKRIEDSHTSDSEMQYFFELLLCTNDLE